MGFSRQEYWSGLPFPSPGDLPYPGIKPRSPALQADILPSEPPGKPAWQITHKLSNLQETFTILHNFCGSWSKLAAWFKYQAGLWGFWAQSLSVLLYFFDHMKQPSFSLHDLPWLPVGRFKHLLIKGGDTRQGRNNQEQPWGEDLFPHQQIHTTMSLSCFADTETPCRWEKLKWCAHKHVDPRPFGTEGWWCWLLLTSPPTHQKNVHELITPSLNIYYKTSHNLLQVGTHSFEGISLLWPPLPGKVIKLSFSTSPKTLS